MNLLYHNLSHRQFEELVIEFCVELLGHTVQGFISGKDGGRDARFVGRAKEYSDWCGNVVIQAKHTEMTNRSFSEADFSGDSDTSIIAKEMPRMKALIKENELDYIHDVRKS